MSDRQDASIAVETSEILGGVLTAGMDPLSPDLVVDIQEGKFQAAIRHKVAQCEAAGGYIDDIKFAVTPIDSPHGPNAVSYAALVMCRMPKDEEETGS